MASAVIDPEAWDLTVVRAQGLRLMRPEKSWRPIVTVEVDKQSRHETVLGVDGQNPNLKALFRFYDVKPTSTLDMKVWHRSQTKKKSKKMNLVASATHCLGDLVRKLEIEEEAALAGKDRAKGGNLLDLRLTCQVPSKRYIGSSSSKGRPQNGASLTVKLVPPPTWLQRKAATKDEPALEDTFGRSDTLETVGYSSEGAASAASSSSSAHSQNSEQHTQIDIHPPSPRQSPTQATTTVPSPPGLRRRTTKRRRSRIKGYSLFSDEEPPLGSGSCSETDSNCSSTSSFSLSGTGSRYDELGSSTSFFEDAVRSTPLDSCFDDYSDTEELRKVDPMDLIITPTHQVHPSAPRTISLETTKTHTHTHITTTDEATKTKTDTDTKRTSVTRWIAASLLPQHVLTHNVSTDSLKPPSDIVPPYTETDITTAGPSSIPMGDVKVAVADGDVEGAVEVHHGATRQKERPKNEWWEVLLGNFTFYLELRDARTDSQFEAVLSNLRMEWTFMAGFLAALGAVDVAVLAINPDNPLIPLTPLSLRAIALSSTFSGLGLTSLAYFILRYSLSTPALFRTRALDLYKSYFFFSLSARVPTLCMVGSAGGILMFLAVVAFEMWPVGTMVGCFFVGVLMSLQFLVYGVHMFVKGVIGCGRRVVGGVRRVVLGKAAGGAGTKAAGKARASGKMVRPTAGV
ncbi:hypothetical protein DFP72DRAFT_910541 [Ephemerocybe angulata]|uniref:C2 domain-containing protein n=1 Tax=Ephemerocybe angulata TaxID=980116 RepID=A0A8H6HQH2_9AGAR|nr:hypothetical protein DFP72DRAFT_910541 [Tulosesus angulatus]